MSRPRRAARPCTVCGFRPRARRGRCWGCYKYWLRHGEDPPEEVLVREGRHASDRLQEQAAIRRLYRRARAQLDRSGA